MMSFTTKLRLDHHATYLGKHAAGLRPLISCQYHLFPGGRSFTLKNEHTRTKQPHLTVKTTQKGKKRQSQMSITLPGSDTRARLVDRLSVWARDIKTSRHCPKTSSARPANAIAADGSSTASVRYQIQRDPLKVPGRSEVRRGPSRSIKALRTPKEVCRSSPEFTGVHWVRPGPWLSAGAHGDLTKVDSCSKSAVRPPPSAVQVQVDTGVSVARLTPGTAAHLHDPTH